MIINDGVRYFDNGSSAEIITSDTSSFFVDEWDEDPESVLVTLDATFDGRPRVTQAVIPLEKLFGIVVHFTQRAHEARRGR